MFPKLISGPEIKQYKIFKIFNFYNISLNINPNIIKHIPLESPSSKESNGGKIIQIGSLVVEGWPSENSALFFIIPRFR
jgi:hypothetical protein